MGGDGKNGIQRNIPMGGDEKTGSQSNEPTGGDEKTGEPFPYRSNNPLRGSPSMVISEKVEIKLEVDGVDLSKCYLQGTERTRLIELLNEYSDVFSN